MAIFHYTVFIIAISLEWISVECCYNNQRLGWCPREGKLHENVCHGVQLSDCTPYHLRCGCTKHTYRRSDRECVARADCGPAEPQPASSGCQDKGPAKKEDKPKQTKDFHPATSQEPSLPDEVPKVPEERPVVTQTSQPLVIYPVASLGTMGCPYDQDKCTYECKKRRYVGGSCDPLVSSFCFCSGPRPLPPSSEEASTSPTEETPNHWPYGQLENGEVLRQFRDTYGCPERTTECLTRCRHHGFFRAFCKVDAPHQCFCWGLASKHNWRDVMLGKPKTENKDPVDCTTQQECDLRCRSSADGGFCTQDAKPLCYCYTKFSPGGYRDPTPKVPTYKDLVDQAKMFLKSKQTFLLTYISLSAWLESYCDCMDSTLVDGSDDAIRRTVVCHGQENKGSGTLMVKGATTATFTVSLKDEATLLQLSTENGTLPYGMETSYKVLAVADTCAVLQIGDMIIERPLCALWRSKPEGYEDERKCLDLMKASCMEPFFDAYRNKDQCT